jgi:hypothetical protein
VKKVLHLSEGNITDSQPEVWFILNNSDTVFKAMNASNVHSYLSVRKQLKMLKTWTMMDLVSEAIKAFSTFSSNYSWSKTDSSLLISDELSALGCLAWHSRNPGCYPHPAAGDQGKFG